MAVDSPHILEYQTARMTTVNYTVVISKDQSFVQESHETQKVKDVSKSGRLLRRDVGRAEVQEGRHFRSCHKP